jgi:hypothetical protein
MEPACMPSAYSRGILSQQMDNKPQCCLQVWIHSSEVPSRVQIKLLQAVFGPTSEQLIGRKLQAATQFLCIWSVQIPRPKLHL